MSQSTVTWVASNTAYDFTKRYWQIDLAKTEYLSSIVLMFPVSATPYRFFAAFSNDTFESEDTTSFLYSSSSHSKDYLKIGVGSGSTADANYIEFTATASGAKVELFYQNVTANKARFLANSIRIYPAAAASGTSMSISEIRPTIQSLADDFVGQRLILSDGITITTNNTGSDVLQINSDGVRAWSGSSSAVNYTTLNALGLTQYNTNFTGTASTTTSKIGYLGTSSGNPVYGAWFPTIAIGGTTFDTAPFQADANGNISMTTANTTVEGSGTSGIFTLKNGSGTVTFQCLPNVDTFRITGSFDAVGASSSVYDIGTDVYWKSAFLRILGVDAGISGSVGLSGCRNHATATAGEIIIQQHSSEPGGANYTEYPLLKFNKAGSATFSVSVLCSSTVSIGSTQESSSLSVDAGANAYGIYSSGTNSAGFGVYGINPNGYGLYGRASNTTYPGVHGYNGVGPAITAQTDASGHNAIYGLARNGYGVYGYSSASSYYGVCGVNGVGDGVLGQATGTGKRGIYGYSLNGYGVYGIASNTSYAAVRGDNSVGYGVVGYSSSSAGFGISGYNTAGYAATFRGYSYQGSTRINADSGAIRLGGTDAYHGRIDYTASGTTVFTFDNTYDNAGAATQFRMRTAGTPVTAMTIYGSGVINIPGHLGLGISAPTEQLHLQSVGASICLYDYASATVDGGGCEIQHQFNYTGVSQTAGGYIGFYRDSVSDGNYGSHIKFATRAHGTSTAVVAYLTGSGQAWFGATTQARSSDARVQIDRNALTGLTDTTAYEVLKLSNTCNTSPTSPKGSNVSLYLSRWENSWNNHPRTRLDFYTTGRTTDNNSTPTFLMCMRDDVKVGIGTTTPAAALDVYQSYSAGLIPFLVNNNSGYGIYVSQQNTLNTNYGVNATSDFYINYVGYADGSTQFRNLHLCNGKGTKVLTVDGVNSRVGVGTDAPTCLLQLNGNNVAYRGQLSIKSTDYSQITFYYGDTTQTDIGASIYRVTSGANGALVMQNYGTGAIDFYGGSNLGIEITGSGTTILRGYSGGIAGSAITGYAKTLVIGGDYNQAYNSGNACLLHIADYSNDSENVYPVFIEDENNFIDFCIYNNLQGSTYNGFTYIGSRLGVGTTSPKGRAEILDNGYTTSDTLLRISADDANPYSLVIGNNTAATTANKGLRFFVNNDGTGVIDVYSTASAQNLLINPNAGKTIVGGNVTAIAALQVYQAYAAGAIPFLVNNNSGYGIYVSQQNTLNTNYGVNATSDFYINYVGYADGSTQFRNLHLCNGKGTKVLTVDGVNKRVGIGTTAPSHKLHSTSSDSIAIYGVSANATYAGVMGYNTITDGVGVYGIDYIGIGVKGYSSASTSYPDGVSPSGGLGIYGNNTIGDAIYGYTPAANYIGVKGKAPSGVGVSGYSSASTSYSGNDYSSGGVGGYFYNAAGTGLFAKTATTSYAMYAYAPYGYGLLACASSSGYYGVYGYNAAGTAIYGYSSASGYYGVSGINNGGGGGIYGKATSSSYYGVYGYNLLGYGVVGYSSASGYYGVYGVNYVNSTGGGVYGKASASSASGVYGYNAVGVGIRGVSSATATSGVNGYNLCGGGYGVYGYAPSGIGIYGYTSGTVTTTYASGDYSSGTLGGYFYNTYGTGIFAKSLNDYAIAALSSGSIAIYGQSNTRSGIYGYTTAANYAGIEGRCSSKSGYTGYFYGGRFAIYLHASNTAGDSLFIVNMPSTSTAGTVLHCDSLGNIYKYTSSIRYKHSVKPLDFNASKFYALQPSSYNDPNREYGFIAEHVNTIFPEMVLKTQEGLCESVKYDQIGVWNTAAIHIHEKQINAQDLRLTEQETKMKEKDEQIQSLTDQINELKALIKGMTPNETLVVS